MQDIVIDRPIENLIKEALKQNNATLVAHYYVSSDLQILAEESGGIVSDSLEMARFGQNSDAETIIVAGVKFMGETAKILSPEKRVLVLDDQAHALLTYRAQLMNFQNFVTRTLIMLLLFMQTLQLRLKLELTGLSLREVHLKLLRNFIAKEKKCFGLQINI